MPAAFPMIRDVAGLRSGEFDVLVIGGGIYGAWIANDAAARGLRVALIEKHDWGAGTSSASSKLIHGGLRYLEHFEFGLVRHALAERRVLSHIAPHLVQALNFLVPVWRDARVGRLQLLAGLTLYDLLATGKQPVPRFKSFARAKLLEAHPYLRADGLRGGLRYGDCQEDDARMTLVVVAAAQAAGAVCANRIEAVTLLEQDDRVCGAQLRDSLSGAAFELRAGLVINAAGPWSRDLLGAEAEPVKLVKGAHLVLPAISGSDADTAFLLTAPADGRVFFVIPWYGRTLVGTTESAVADPSIREVTPAEQRYLLDAVAALMPGLGWTDADVVGAFAGVRSLQADDADNLSSVTREFIVLEPRPGVLWPLGGKYTTARCDAVDVVDRALQLLQRDAVPCTTARTLLPGAPSEIPGQGDFSGWQTEALPALLRRGIDAQATHYLTLRHGTRIARIHQLLDENPLWCQRLHVDAPFIVAEAVLAIRDEMAFDSDDILRRRMPLKLLVRDPQAAIAAVEELLREAAKSELQP
ncbi:MAG: glycerol-3-phosphate dehydrogenase/oxidase [Nevskia sp.]|nr:glycerol-3-phosphate dehydrogenase/oxidase [Nevskia sp.]